MEPFQQRLQAYDCAAADLETRRLLTTASDLTAADQVEGDRTSHLKALAVWR
jgi:hypothetical protein